MPAPSPSWTRRLPVLLLAAAVLAALWWRGRQPPTPPAIEIGTSVMGTDATVTLWPQPGGEADAEAAGRAVLDIFAAIEARFSTYRDDSEVSRLNATAHDQPFACSPEMWAALQLSRQAWEVSGGAFDVTAGPLMHLWGFHRHRNTLPTPAEVAAARDLVGFDKLVLDEQTHSVAFPRAGMSLDFGGILKGQALDLAAAELERRGCRIGMVNLGGNICCLPEPPPGRQAYRIGVRHPRHPRDDAHLLGRVEMLGQAIATSGDYERFVVIDGTRYSHIMDPRTGYPVRGMAAVTVIHPRGVVTDMLSTSIFVNGGRHLAALREQYPQAQVLLVRAAGDGTLDIEKHGDIRGEIGPLE